MSNKNVLPIQTGVRQRQSIHISNAQGQSSGTIALQLDRPSRISVGAVGLADGCPAIVVVKFDGVPTLGSWDVFLVLRGIAQQPVLASIGLPAGSHTLNWASFDEFMDSMEFPAENLGMVFAVVDT
ncbi:MAG: hypothetical protein ACUVRS_09170 [Armatimonadota bacterium]